MSVPALGVIPKYLHDAKAFIPFYSLFFRTFDQTVGTFNELQKYLQGYVATLDRDDKKRHAR